MPVPAEFSTCRSGITVSSTTRNLLLPDRDRHGIYRRAYQLMNAAPGGVLDRFGFRVQHPGTDGAWLSGRPPRSEDGSGTMTALAVASRLPSLPSCREAPAPQ